MYAIQQSIFCVLNAATQQQIIVCAGNAHVIAIHRTLVVTVFLFAPDHFNLLAPEFGILAHPVCKM